MNSREVPSRACVLAKPWELDALHETHQKERKNKKVSQMFLGNIFLPRLGMLGGLS